MAPETIDGIDASEIEAGSTERLTWLRFPPAIEVAYESETGPGRSRELFWRGMVAIGIYLLLLIPDWFVTPDIFGTGVLVRLGVVAPALLIMSFFMWRNPPASLREGMVVLSVLLVAAGQIFLMLLSTAPMREMQHHVMVLLILVLVVQRVSFFHAAAGSLGVAVLYHFGLVSLGDYPLAAMVTDELLFGGAVVLSLMALYSIDRVMRLNYLGSLRSACYASGWCR